MRDPKDPSQPLDGRWPAALLAGVVFACAFGFPVGFFPFAFACAFPFALPTGILKATLP